MERKREIWLFGKWIDLLVLFMPVWMVWAICFGLPASILEREISIWLWVVLVVGIDVSHVWSSLYRTYLSKEEFQQHKRLLIISPIVVFVLVFLLAGYSQQLFWTVLAYTAVYHFVKQQYGFLRLYRAKLGDYAIKKVLKDEWVIYLGMVYPLVYWHFSPDRHFEWFVEGDFLNLNVIISDSIFSTATTFFNLVYWLLILLWVTQETVLSKRHNLSFPIGKIAWVVTTAMNWFLGIVYFNSDLAFTATNVIAHGIPYMLLIFYYVEKKKAITSTKRRGIGVVIWNVVIMLVGVLILAIGEEYFWDMWLYRENQMFFEAILPFSMGVPSTQWLQALVIGLLTVPQATHYIIDGFIWKGNKKNPYVRKVLING